MQTWFTPGRVLLEQSISDSYFFNSLFIHIQQKIANNLHINGQILVPLLILDGNQWSTRTHLHLGGEWRVVSMGSWPVLQLHIMPVFQSLTLLYLLLCLNIGRLVLNFIWSKIQLPTKCCNHSKKMIVGDVFTPNIALCQGNFIKNICKPMLHVNYYDHSMVVFISLLGLL